MAPKNKDNINQKGRVIYRYKCDTPQCDGKYIRESARTFGERLKEHLRAPFLSMTMPTPQDTPLN